jgi:hypothetical protein
MEFVKLLQAMQKTAPVLQTKTVDITGTKLTDSIEIAFTKATKDFQSRIPYNIASYDVDWMRDCVIRKIEAAQKISQTSITLENRCCTRDDCPQMLFMTIFVECQFLWNVLNKNEFLEKGLEQRCHETYHDVPQSKRFSGIKKMQFNIQLLRDD